MAPPPPPQQYYAPQPMMMPPQYNMPPVGYPQQPGGYPYGQQMPSHQHQMYGAPQGTSSQMVPQHYGASQQQQQQQQQQQAPPQYGMPVPQQQISSQQQQRQPSQYGTVPMSQQQAPPQQQIPPQYGMPVPQYQEQYPSIDTSESNGTRNKTINDDDDDDENVEKLQVQMRSESAVERYTVRFEHEQKLGMLLERRQDWTPGQKKDENNGDKIEDTVVTMVIDGGAAQSKGIVLGSRLIQINDMDATKMPYSKNLDLVKTLSRPLVLVFERSKASCDTAKGVCLIRKSAGTAPPSSISSWKQSYFVVGGAVAKRNVLQFYDNKALYEDIVVKMFQNHPVAGLKYKAYAISSTFKCSEILSKSYKSAGGNITLKYFTLKNPNSKTKTIKIAAENPSVLFALHSHIMRYASKG
mmetsp:Transcript_4715/g.6685  ORF Transcript_4715/g.6685 Transcript_4715/m.6685 type:complete len:411 (+) Transcript_4715:100-1332(+)